MAVVSLLKGREGLRPERGTPGGGGAARGALLEVLCGELEEMLLLSLAFSSHLPALSCAYVRRGFSIQISFC